MTLEGTIIHKSGLITGGRSTHDSGKKWEEKDIQGMFSFLTMTHTGLADTVVSGRAVACERQYSEPAERPC